MRVLYFSRDYTPHDHRFLSSLVQSEHQVHWLRLEQRGQRQDDRPLPPQVNYIEWAGGLKPAEMVDYPRLLLSLRRVLHRLKPDLVHAGPVQSTAFLTALSGFRPLLTMSWAYDLLFDANRNTFSRWVTGFTLRRSAVLACDSQVIAQQAQKWGLPAERIVVFPWGIDLQQFSPGKDDNLRYRRGWQQTFVLLHLRAWEPLYGVDVFIQGFILAAQQLPELRLFMLGKGSLAPQIRKALMQAGMMDRVHFDGQVNQSDLPRFYQAADLYVSASHSDGSSVSLMEALGCGLPVLLSDIPGNRQWIEHGRQGWLFPDGDADALAAGILQAAKNPKRSTEIGANARKLAEERADWRLNFQQLLQAYQMVMGRKSRQ